MKISWVLLGISFGMFISACACTTPTTDIGKIEGNQHQVFAQSRLAGKNGMLVSDWNTKAHELCDGDFQILTRHFNSQGQGYSTMSGMVACK